MTPLSTHMKTTRIRKALHPALIARGLKKPMALVIAWEEGRKIPDPSELFRWTQLLGEDFLEAAKFITK